MFVRDWIEKLKDPTRDPYERRFRVFAPVGIATVLVWVIVISIIDYNPVRLFFFLLMLSLYALTVLLTVRTGHIQWGAAICALGMELILMPYCFLQEGGVSGGAFNYAVSAMVFILMSVKGRLRTVLIAVDVLAVTGCFLLSYRHAELFYVPPDHVVMVNAYTEMIIACILAFAAIMFQLYMFRQERTLMEKQNREIEDLNRSQNRFFSSMSHEIRTPINTIIGMNELIMRDRTLSDDGAEKARSVDNASKMLLALINDILDLSKMESGKMDIVPVEYDVADMLSDVTGMISGRAADKGLQFRVDVDEALPSRLYGDEVRVKQVLVNLLNNAVKYTKQGSVTMSVQGDRTDNRKLMLVARIEDTGIGIKKEAIPYLFEAFKRVDETKNRNIEGTGLGLSIVKQITDLMGGKIGVSSIYTKGSTFTVSLPQEIADDTPVKDIGLRMQGTGSGREYYKQKFEAPDARLLIVDDNEMNLAVEKGLLGETRMTVDTALSGSLALQMTQNTVYDVIFMDHLMPEMDGIECFKQIREQEGGLNRETPVIALTANAGSENQALYAASGFNGYLLKPVNGAQLEETLLRALPESKVHLTGASTMQSDTTGFFEKLGRKKRVAVTMDSGCDLPKEWIDRYGIGVASYLIETGGGIFLDNMEIDSDGLTAYMEDSSHVAKSHPPTVAQFERLFGSALNRAQSVIHITLSASMTDSHANACEAAKSFDNVTVFDSGAISSGAGMMAVYAAFQADADRSAEEILFNLRLVKPQVHTSFVLYNGQSLVHSGRLRPSVNALLDAFLMHPVIHMREGKFRTGVTVFSSYRRQYIRKTLLRHRAVDTSLLILCYVGLTEQELSDIRTEIDKTLKFDRVVVMPASGAIAVNSGPGAFGLIYRTLGNDRETGKPLFTSLPEMEREDPRIIPEEEDAFDTLIREKAETDRKGAIMLDEEQGIAACGSREAYENVKRMFAENAAEKTAEIERFFAEEDWENYTIRVHALKSGARLIGATALSKLAERLEACGNAAKG